MPAPSSPLYAATKRAADVAGAVVLGLLSLPLAAGIAAAVAAESGRPVFFRQTRAGRAGRPFTLWKFRTLYPGPHDPERPLARVTRVGAWLRRWGLDELPQLWNVVRGEMSLVGPRPALPEQAAAYDAYERQRLAVRPGLTGWAQIHGRNALSWPERIRLDVWYVRHAGPLLDLRVLLRTPAALRSGAGVYGAGGRNPTFGPRAAAPETQPR
ncbi:MAG: sugar transferase [Rhodothermales bacterium]|nr:sugar transferase [Rhodothermales bacterium]